MALIKIEIKSRYSDKVLFSYESENNTIKDTLLEAVRKNVDIRGANLCDANLRDANLRGADISSANLRNTNLSDAYLSDAYLRYANLGDANLSGANLSDADLRGANLCGANLRGANLNGADLSDAYLNGADLRNANLSDADLSVAYLTNANLCGAYLGSANLCGAYLCGANLSGANFCNAYLGSANLRDANLRGAKEIPFVPFCCPSEGSFIGWKKVSNYLIKLQIPEDAKRSSATSQKCRCDKAKVLAITKLDGTNPISEIENFGYSPSVLYKVGEMVIPDSFDEDRWNECSHGIHFFINKQDAINYNF